MYPKFCVIFPNFTPTTRGLFMIRPERFQLFYIGRCPICFLQNISLIRLVVLEKKMFEGFLPYLVMAAILNSWSKPFYIFFVPPVPGCYIWNLVTFGPVVSEEKSFESVDGRRTDDGGFPYYKLSQSLWLRGAKKLFISYQIFKKRRQGLGDQRKFSKWCTWKWIIHMYS